MERDLTTGRVPAQLIAFAFPILIANLLQSAYSIADMAIVGRFTGSAGLAAVSSAAMIGFVIQSVCGGITMGGTVLIAQLKGAGKKQEQERAVGTLFSVSAAAAVVVTIFSLLLYQPVFRWMNLPEEAMPHGVSYMRIICLGTIFVFGYNAVCAVMRGLGDSKSPMLFVASAAILNLVLDVILVGPAGMGTAGAALATVVSQGASCFGAAVYLRHRNFFFDFSRRSFRIDRGIAVQLLRIGLPSAVQMAVLNASYLFVTGMLNQFGVAVAAASGAGLKVNTFAAMPCWAVGQAVTAMAGQNIGAGNLERTNRVAKLGLALSLAVTLVMMLFIQLFAEPIITMFDSSPETIREGVLYLRICCSLNCLAYAVMYTFDSFATGVGDAFFAMCNALLHSVVMRLLLSWLLGYALGGSFVGIYWAECLCCILPALVGTFYFCGGRWKRRI